MRILLLIVATIVSGPAAAAETALCYHVTSVARGIVGPRQLSDDQVRTGLCKTYRQAATQSECAAANVVLRSEFQRRFPAESAARFFEGC